MGVLSYSDFLRYRPHSFAMNPHMYGISLFRNESGIFLESEAIFRVAELISVIYMVMKPM